MAGRNCADIVFCIDASGSMKPCLEAVCKNVASLVSGLKNDGQIEWDVRFDFLAFSDSSDEVHRYIFTKTSNTPGISYLYKERDESKFFTRDLQEFKKRLSSLGVDGEEAQLIALDTALDFPWRNSSECHRVVILLTDEAIETGVSIEEQKKTIPELIKKIAEKRIKLFIVAPESEAFYELAEVDQCEYTPLDNSQNGLEDVDFSKMLATIGRSVSVSQTYEGASSEPRPLFGQDMWVSCQRDSLGSDK